MNYPKEAEELVTLLAQDQAEWSAYAKAEYVDKLPAHDLQNLKRKLRKKVAERGERALEILSTIGTLPSLSNIGQEAAVALSVIATHYSLTATQQVLAAFETCYRQTPDDTHRASIPAMTDWVAVLEHRPQKFGTIWLFDENNYPFLPTVEDYQTINERRSEYGIEPLRWPKSMVLPTEDQPWLMKPLTNAVMRDPTEGELQKLTEFY